MKVSISELMRLRKEISGVISLASYKFQNCRYGESFIGDTNTTNNHLSTFSDLSNSISRLLDISLLINDTIEQFNCDNKIGSLVRQKANILMQIKLLENAIIRSQPHETITFNIVGSERVEVKNKFVPYINKSDIKIFIKKFKKGVRDIQNKIDNANASIINIPVEYDDIEELIADFNN